MNPKNYLTREYTQYIKKIKKIQLNKRTETSRSDTALSAVSTAGAMIHCRIHSGMSWRAINHLYCTHPNLICSLSLSKFLNVRVCV